MSDSIQSLEPTSIVFLSPSLILADDKDNVRLSLKPAKIQQRKLSILEHGQQQPVHVEQLVAPIGTRTHRLISGYYRLAAINAINAEAGADNQMAIAAIVSGPLTPTERFKMQVVENDREEASLMDTAVAIKKALDLGLSRAEVRSLYARPKGKKLEVTPASNAWINMMLGLLDLPKGVQDRIHNGVLGLKAAYTLGRLPKEDQQAIIERAERDREKVEERENKEEAKLLKVESKMAAQDAKLREAADKVSALRQEGIEARAVFTQRKMELANVKAEPSPDADNPVEVKQTFERMKAAQVNVTQAQKLVKKATGDLAKAIKAKQKLEDRSSDEEKPAPKPKPRQGKAKSAKSSGISSDEVVSAAKKQGVAKALLKPLNLQELKDVIYDVKKSKVNAKVTAIGEAFEQCLKSVLTTNQLIAELIRIVAPAKK